MNSERSTSFRLASDLADARWVINESHSRWVLRGNGMGKSVHSFVCISKYYNSSLFEKKVKLDQ